MEDHCASSGWSELPWDLLDRIVQHLELPEALAVASVCAPWRSAAVASGVPRSGTPWLVSQSRVLSPHKKTESETPGSEFRNLLGTNSKTYTVSLPQGRRHLAWCGASHGWLIASDELSNLVLYNPFTFAVVPLPPITDLGGVMAVYNDDGTIVGYHYGNHHELLCRPPNKLGCSFYEKVVLSRDPSHGGGDCIAMAIYGVNQVNFARAGESSWLIASTAPCQKDQDLYADCVHHNGRFYAVTMGGAVETWDLDEAPEHEPNKQVIVAGDRMFTSILTRFLVSTPWGGLLQIRVLRRTLRRRRIKVEVLEINVEERKLVRLSPATALRKHAVFLGSNESACLDVREFPELRPNCVYFTTPWLAQEEDFGLEDRSGLYDLESQTFEHLLPRPKRSKLCPREVWFVPNI